MGPRHRRTRRSSRVGNPGHRRNRARAAPRRRLPRGSSKVVRAHAPGEGARRQGAQLPQAGSRLELSRPLRRPRRDPARARHDLPARPRLSLPLLPRPHDLRGGGPHARGGPPERDVEGDRRRLRRPPHVESLREDLHRDPERLFRRLQPRAARRGPRPRGQDLSPGGRGLLLRGRVVDLGGLLLRGRQRRHPGEGARRVRRPGQRVRHLGPQGGPDREPRTRPTTSPGSRTSRSSTATASTSSTPSAPCARPWRSCAPAPAPRWSMRPSCGSTPTPTPTARSSTARRRSWPRPAPRIRCPASESS